MDARKGNAETELNKAKEKFKEAPFSEDLKSITQDCLAFDPHSRPDAITIQQRADQHLRSMDPTRESQTLVAHRTGNTSTLSVFFNHFSLIALFMATDIN